uniref:MFS domain-containing protein n=1 Tax=Rhabditophanes sp. KR3021 TaxID=114890 RepID=A0AC35TLI9_9BILA
MSEAFSDTKSMTKMENVDGMGPHSDKLPLKRTIFIVFVSICLTVITNLPSGSSHTTINTGAALIDAYMNSSYLSRGSELSHGEISLLRSGLSSSWYVGQIIGTLISPIIMNHLGRKGAYILSQIGMTSACALQWASTHSPYPEVFFAGRVLASIFSPLSDAALIIYTREIAPPHLVGAVGSMMNPGFSVCALIGALLSTKHILGDSLNKMLFVPILPGILGLLFLIWIPETPKFLYLSKNDERGARRSLKFYQGKKSNIDATISSFEYEKIQELSSEGGKFTDVIFIPHVRKATLLCMLVFLCTLPFYPFLSYSTHFLVALKIDLTSSQYLSTVIMVILTISAAISPIAISKYSRRGMVLGFGSLGVVCIALITVCSFFIAINPMWKYACVVFMIGYIVCHGLAIGSIAWFVGTELVSHEYSSIVLCFCIGVQSFLIAGINFATIPLFDHFGTICYIPLFCIPSAICLVILYYHLPETKDANIVDVIIKLKGGIKKSKKTIFPLFAPLIVGDNLKKTSTIEILDSPQTSTTGSFASVQEQNLSSP